MYDERGAATFLLSLCSFPSLVLLPPAPPRPVPGPPPPPQPLSLSLSLSLSLFPRIPGRGARARGIRRNRDIQWELIGHLSICPSIRRRRRRRRLPPPLPPFLPFFRGRLVGDIPLGGMISRPRVFNAPARPRHGCAASRRRALDSPTWQPGECLTNPHSRTRSRTFGRVLPFPGSWNAAWFDTLGWRDVSQSVN